MTESATTTLMALTVIGVSARAADASNSGSPVKKRQKRLINEMGHYGSLSASSSGELSHSSGPRA
jgi:hypothetical protein